MPDPRKDVAAELVDGERRYLAQAGALTVAEGEGWHHCHGSPEGTGCLLDDVPDRRRHVDAQEKDRRRWEADIERTKGHARTAELTTPAGVTAPHLKRVARLVARKAKVRERRLRRQMASVAWIARPATRLKLNDVLKTHLGKNLSEGELAAVVAALAAAKLIAEEADGKVTYPAA